MNDTLMQQGTDLMLYGMGSVLVFLTLLVIATTLLTGLIRRWFPEPEPIPSGRPAKRSGAARKPASAEVDDTVLKVIKAAVEKHRARR